MKTFYVLVFLHLLHQRGLHFPGVFAFQLPCEIVWHVANEPLFRNDPYYYRKMGGDQHVTKADVRNSCSLCRVWVAHSHSPETEGANTTQEVTLRLWKQQVSFQLSVWWHLGRAVCASPDVRALQACKCVHSFISWDFFLSVYERHFVNNLSRIMMYLWNYATGHEVIHLKRQVRGLSYTILIMSCKLSLLLARCLPIHLPYLPTPVIAR